MPGHATRSGARISASEDYFAITPSDTVNMSRPSYGGIRVANGPGEIAAVRADGEVVTISVGELDYLPIVATRINATGTTEGLELVAL